MGNWFCQQTSRFTRRRALSRGEALSSNSEGAAAASPSYHLPALADEVVDGLAVSRGGVYLDGTLGDGGHSLAILRRMSEPEQAGATEHESEPGQDGYGLVLALDLDGRAVADASRRLAAFGPAFRAAQGNYADMLSLAAGMGVAQVDGILLDLGFSSRQVDRPGYGLSFQTDEPLDMRYDRAQAVTAADLVNGASENELADIFRRLGEEPRARALSRAIARERSARPHYDHRRTGESGGADGGTEADAPAASGHQGFPGPANCGEPGAGEFAGRTGSGRGPTQAGRQAGGNQLPQFGRPHSQEFPGASFGYLRLSSRTA